MTSVSDPGFETTNGLRGRKRPWAQALGLVLLIGLVWLVEHAVGWAELLRPWLALNVVELIVATTLGFASYWLRAIRLHDYFREETRGRITLALRLMLLHNLLNNLLPMRTGELSFPLLMRRYFQVSLGRSVAALIWFRLLDLHTIVLIALVALAIETLPPLLGTAAIGLFLILPWLLYRLREPAWSATVRYLPIAWSERLAPALEGLPTRGVDFARSWAWTLANWGVKLAAFGWILGFFGDLDWGPALLGAVAGELTSVLPVHGVAGAGTYEAGIVAALIPFGIAATDALVAAVNLHLFMLGLSVLGAGVALGLGNRHLR
jgi:uncharacterized membrane protein YbhN (UPF0104 family)